MDRGHDFTPVRRLLRLLVSVSVAVPSSFLRFSMLLVSSLPLFALLLLFVSSVQPPFSAICLITSHASGCTRCTLSRPRRTKSMSMGQERVNLALVPCHNNNTFDCTHSLLFDVLETSWWCTVGCNLPQERIWHKVRYAGDEFHIDHKPFRIVLF
jgi:hypothetical protein